MLYLGPGFWYSNAYGDSIVLGVCCGKNDLTCRFSSFAERGGEKLELENPSSVSTHHTVLWYQAFQSGYLHFEFMLCWLVKVFRHLTVNIAKCI